MLYEHQLKGEREHNIQLRVLQCLQQIRLYALRSILYSQTLIGVERSSRAPVKSWYGLNGNLGRRFCIWASQNILDLLPPVHLSDLIVILDSTAPEQLPHALGYDPNGMFGNMRNDASIKVIEVVVGDENHMKP